MASEFSITLPQPPKELHPNSRVHWRRRIEPKKRYRHAVEMLARSELPDGWESLDGAVVEQTWRFSCRRRRDEDNLRAWMKPAYDALTRAGVWADDHNVTTPVIRYQYGAREPSVTLTIRPRT